MRTVQIDVSRKTARGWGRERERRSPLCPSPSLPPPFKFFPALWLRATLQYVNAWKSDANYKSCVRVVAFATALLSLVWTSPYFSPSLPPKIPITFDTYFCNFCSASRVSYMLFEKEPADYTKARVTLYFWSNLTIKSIKPRCIFCRLDYGSFLHQLLSEPTVILWQWQLKASVDHVCYYTGNFQTCKRKTLHCDVTEDRVILKDDNI